MYFTLDKIPKKPLKQQTYCIILSPTRELANQTFNVVQSFVNVLNNPPVSCELLIGGSGNQRISDDLKLNGVRLFFN
jgi:superfamily II DNA/RNA helicase